MKALILIFSFLTAFQASAATAPTTPTDEITLEDLQEEFMKEADTLVVDDEDETFLDEELEAKAKVQAQEKTTVPNAKSTAKAPAATAPKK